MMKHLVGIALAIALALIAQAAAAQGTSAPAAKPSAPAVSSPTTASAATTAATTAATPPTTEKIPAATTATAATTTTTATIPPVSTADQKTSATENCKKKGLVGVALDECVKNEVTKSLSTKGTEPVGTVQTLKPIPAPAKAAEETAAPTAARAPQQKPLAPATTQQPTGK